MMRRERTSVTQKEDKRASKKKENELAKPASEDISSEEIERA